MVASFDFQALIVLRVSSVDIAFQAGTHSEFRNGWMLMPLLTSVRGRGFS